MGMKLSPEVEAKIPKVIRMICEEVEECLGRKLNMAP
jgi:Ni,Fe-hydrogenase maturation factor